MSRAGCGLQASVSWIPARNGDIPGNAVVAADNIYICRTSYDCDVVPGKIDRRHSCAYISYDGKEQTISNYEVLCTTGLQCFGQEMSWKHGSNGHVPPGALVGGKTGCSEPLYVARGRVNGEWCAGKVHGSHGCAYFPWGGEEHKSTHYEVLCFC